MLVAIAAVYGVTYTNDALLCYLNLLRKCIPAGQGRFLFGIARTLLVALDTA